MAILSANIEGIIDFNGKSARREGKRSGVQTLARQDINVFCYLNVYIKLTSCVIIQSMYVCMYVNKVRSEPFFFNV